MQFGLPSTLRRLRHVTLRDAPPSLDGGLIGDYHGPADRHAELAAKLSATPGVIGHGLFEPGLVSVILIGRGDDVERRDLRG
jgi:ribose 5-phosphate isomerase A